MWAPLILGRIGIVSVNATHSTLIYTVKTSKTNSCGASTNGAGATGGLSRSNKIKLLLIIIINEGTLIGTAC